MGNLFGSTPEESRGLFGLLKAHYQQKSLIKHQISRLTIKQNYHKSNPTPRLEQETLELDKIASHKILSLKQLVKDLRKKQPPTMDEPGIFLREILNLPNQKMCHFLQNEDPEELIIKEQEDLEYLQITLARNQGRIQDFKNWYIANEERIDEKMKSFALLSKQDIQLSLVVVHVFTF